MKPYSTTLFFLFLFLFSLNAQSTINIDSCHQVVLAEKDVKKRGNLITALLREIPVIDSTTYWDVSNWYVELAEETGQEKYRATAYLKQGYVLEKSGHPQKAIARLKEAAEIYKQQVIETDDEEITRRLAFTYGTISNSYGNLDDYEKCLEYLGMTQDIFIETKDSMNIARCYNSYGYFYKGIGQNDKAIKYFTEALDLLSRFEYPGATNLAKLNIAAILTFQGKLDRAERYTKECLEGIAAPDYPKQHDKGGTYLLAHELYIAKGDRVTAIKYLDKMVDLYEKNDHQYRLGKTYVLKGKMAIEKGDLPQAKLYLDKVKQIMKSVPEMDLKSSYKDEMVRYYTAIGDFANAQKVSDEIQAFYKNNSDLPHYSLSFLNLANLEKKRGNAIGVFESMEKYKAIQDSITNEKVLINQELYEVQYETSKKEQAILLLSGQKKTQKNRIIMLLSLLGLLLAGGGAFYYRQKLNEQLRLQSMRSQISSDLHDEVGSSLSRLSMIMGSIDDSDTASAKGHLQKGNEILSNSISKIRDVVWAIDAQNDAVGDLLDRMEDFAYDMLSSKEIRFKINTEGLDRKKTLPPLLRQNFYLFYKEAITNISKHSNADLVNINFAKKGKKLALSVKDNGKDLNDKKVTGSGMSNMRLRAKKINGQFDFAKGAQGFMVNLEAPIG